MANKRIKDLTEKSSFVSGDYFPIDNDNGTKKVNASKIMSPLSSAQTDATRALNMARNTSSFPTGDAYSSSSSYKVGNMVIYNNTLYRCKTACSAASWSVNANNFEAISLASAITDLNNDLSKHAFGTNVILGTNEYTFPTDGYLVIHSKFGNGNYLYVDLYGSDKVNKISIEVSSDTHASQSETIFVRKGMSVKYYSSNGENSLTFVPLQ